MDSMCVNIGHKHMQSSITQDEILGQKKQSLTSRLNSSKQYQRASWTLCLVNDGCEKKRSGKERSSQVLGAWTDDEYRSVP